MENNSTSRFITVYGEIGNQVLNMYNLLEAWDVMRKQYRGVFKDIQTYFTRAKLTTKDKANDNFWVIPASNGKVHVFHPMGTRR